MKIYIDGSGWNGTKSRAIVVNEEGKAVSKISTTRNMTNNQMEYKALIEGLNFLMENDIKNAVIYTDSQLVVGQVTKNWKVTKEHLLPLVLYSKRLMETTKTKLVWIPREKNKAGWLLEARDK